MTMETKYSNWDKNISARKLLKEDLDACAGKSRAKRLMIKLFGLGYKATVKYRYANMLYYKYGFKILPRWLRYRSRVKYGVDIDFRAKIGGGFRVAHGAGVVIGCDVNIGRNVAVYQGVTLGGNAGKTQTINGVTVSQPWLEDNVCVFAGSTILGPVHVGRNSQVGAGTVLMKNVPENSVVFCKQEMVIKEQRTDGIHE